MVWELYIDEHWSYNFVWVYGYAEISLLESMLPTIESEALSSIFIIMRPELSKCLYFRYWEYQSIDPLCIIVGLVF